MENQHQVVALVGFWLLLLCCRSALLPKPSAKFWPIQLSQPERATAEFNCSISNVAVSNHSIYWYKLDADGQPSKLETSNKNKKYRVTRLDSQTFQMRILKLEKNDSGTYFCTLVSFSLERALTESNQGNLTVTEIAPESGSSEEEEEKEENDEKIGENTDYRIPLAATGGSALLLVLVASLCFFLINVIWRRRGRRRHHDENAPLEAEPPAVAVFTVDYGVLEFEAGQNARRPPPSPKQQPSDQTEYATIVFPSEKPAPVNTKRTKKQGRCPTIRAQLQ